MEIDAYRIYRNRPKPLMGCPIVYRISDYDTGQSFGGDGQNIDKAIRQEHPSLSRIKALRYNNFTYKGVNMEGSDE